MLKYSFLLIISFTSLALISLPNNIFSEFKDRKINRILFYKSIKSISGFVFMLTLLQILSFKLFLISNILKPFIYIIYSRSLLRSTIILLSYFLSSAFLNIFLNNNFEINLLLKQQQNADFYIILCFIYIFLSLLTFSNAFTSKLLSLYERYPQSLTLKVFLSILLSARFNFLNKNFLFLSIFIGFFASLLITISAYNLSSDIFLINLLALQIFALIIYFSNNLFYKDKKIKKSEKLIKSVNAFIKEFLDNTNQRVFVASYCYKKDKSLLMLSNIIKLMQKKYMILGGGYSKNIVLLHPEKNFIYKIFGSEDDSADNYYEYHLDEGFRKTFKEYDQKVFYYKKKKINYIKIPFFKGKTAFEQFFYYGNKNTVNENKINKILKSIFIKIKDLHSIEILNRQKYFTNSKLTKEDLSNYLNLKFLKDPDQLLRSRIFLENEINISKLKNSLNNLSKEWDQSNQDIVFTHGDLSFSNIIVSSVTNDEAIINFIDPNPSNLYLFPSPITDISKLLQSTYVMWELATQNNDYLKYGIKKTNGIFKLPQPHYFNYAEVMIRKLANELGFSNKIQDLHLIIHLKRILPYISNSHTLKEYIIGYIYFILFEKY